MVKWEFNINKRPTIQILLVSKWSVFYGGSDRNRVHCGAGTVQPVPAGCPPDIRIQMGSNPDEGFPETVVGMTGIEPATLRLRVGCSASWATLPYFFVDHPPPNSIRRAETSDRSRGPKDEICPMQFVTHCPRPLPAAEFHTPSGD